MSSSSGAQSSCGFCKPVRCNISAYLGKAVLTFSAERLITESTKEWHIFSDEVQGLWTMAVLSHCINPPDSAVIVHIYCTKADFACVIGLYIMTIVTKVGVVLSSTYYYSTRYQDRLVCLTPALSCLLKSRNLFYYNKISQLTRFLDYCASTDCKTEMWYTWICSCRRFIQLVLLK